MRKLLLFTSFLIVTASIFFSCDKTKTPQELMEEEKKSIDRFIAKNGFEILKSYPADSTFKEKQYFKTPEGVYMNVVNRGNGTKAEYKQEVTVRFRNAVEFKSDTTKYSNTNSESFLEMFYSQYSYNSSLACAGWDIALQYVSDRAKVRLIIPSSYRESDASGSYSPIYYEELNYRFK